MAKRDRRGIDPGDGDPRHGTANGYNNLLCRCDDCREAWRVRHRKYMHGDSERAVRHRERQSEYRARKAKK